MLEALVLAAGLGFLLALRFRVPALVAASAVAIVLGPVIAHLTGAPSWAVLSAPLVVLVALQCGYLGGLLLTYTLTRAEPRLDEDAATKESGDRQTKRGPTSPPAPFLRLSRGG
jgi:hypothetical protein